MSEESSFSVEIPALLDGVRVDRAVSLLTGVSRSAAGALVDAGDVLVDGVAVASRKVPLVAGGTLAVQNLVSASASMLAAEPEVQFGVVHEDESVIVVNKPPGLVVHPGAGHATGTLAAGLLARFPDLAELVSAGVCEPERPGIVHRLDRGTSGLLVVARTAEAFGDLVGQLGRHSVERRYFALVRGHLGEDRGVIDAPIGRSNRQPTKMTVSAKGRDARTTYRVLDRVEEPLVASLLDVALETGRTHQIRVHLAAIGHPVIGDERYGKGERRLLVSGRFFLHAHRLSFDHPDTGQRATFEAPLPGDLAALVVGAPLEGGAGT